MQSFTQSHETVTLVFVSSADADFQNLEAVIDGVSYYSENEPSNNSENGNGGTRSNDRNTIWLNNFDAGSHTIQVYTIRNGTKDERAANSPAYQSTFIVKEGYDTKIAIRSAGQVQFSQRLGANSNSPVDNVKNNNDINVPRTDDKILRSSSAHDEIASDKKDEADSRSPDDINSAPVNDQNIDDNNNNDKSNGRHSRKRIDTAKVLDDDNGNINENSDPVNDDKRKTTTERRNKNGNSNRVFSDRDQVDNGPTPMDDEHFTTLYETLRNQWLPGQKMKTLSNEFLNMGDNFTTMQAKQLILLVTDELNRLKLAKSSYHSITDPENFSEIDDIFRYQESKDELDDFIGNNRQQVNR